MLDSAKTALGKEDCRKLLQGTYDGDLAELLTRIKNSGRITYGTGRLGTRSGDTIDVNPAWRAGNTPANSLIYVNEYGPWDNPRNTFLKTPGGVQSFDYLTWWNQTFETNHNEDQLRTTVILHELGHVTGAFGPDSTAGQSQAYTEEVIKKCM